MRKIVLILAVLTVTSSAWASVDISCDVFAGARKVTVYYDSSELNNVRAYAFDITLTPADVNIVDVTYVDPNYYIHPGSFELDEFGNVMGSVVCDPMYPDTLPGLGSNAMTIEMASLYVGEANAPGKSGVLIEFTVDGDCAIEIAPNLTRTGANANGVVMENPDEQPVVNISSCRLCKGDINGDHWIKATTDMSALVIKLNAIGAPYRCQEGQPCYDRNFDVNADGWIKATTDMSALVQILNAIGAPYRQACP